MSFRVLLEPEGGVLRAQRAVRALAAQAADHGAADRARAGAAARRRGRTRRLDAIGGGRRRVGVRPVAGANLSGPRRALSHAAGAAFFDGGPAWRAPGLPAWCDYDRARYGTADIDRLGVKAGIDDLGPPLDPDAELTNEATTEPQVRAYLRDRFPALEHTRLLEARSSRYELTPDTHFIAATHPEHPNVWLVGGGSGHGFKHGPPMAERLAQAFRDGAPLPARFGLGERGPSTSMRTASSGIAP